MTKNSPSTSREISLGILRSLLSDRAMSRTLNGQEPFLRRWCRIRGENSLDGADSGLGGGVFEVVGCRTVGEVQHPLESFTRPQRLAVVALRECGNRFAPCDRR